VRRLRFIISSDPKALTPCLPAIQALADSEKHALGFLPAKAFEEAIRRRRLIVALVQERNARTFAGYLLHSGVFPNAKIQQIATAPSFRMKGAASALIKALVSELERVGFLSIRADVASDLPATLTFYRENGFVCVRDRPGGATRNRTIIIHSRELETDSLLTIPSAQSAIGMALGVRRHSPREPMVFAFDLNVYFDLVRQRDQSDRARRLFGEALGHTIRLAVADEFVAELRKTSNSNSPDPVFQMALQLPRLPKPDGSQLGMLAERIYDAVFVKPNAKGVGTAQAKSDAMHIAHATIARASAFVTRDGPILNARNELLATFGIDIATVDEVLDLLPPEPLASDSPPRLGEGFELGALDSLQLTTHLSNQKIPNSVFSDFAATQSSTAFVRREAIRCDNRIIAVGAALLPKAVDPVARMIVHVQHEHEDAELFADYLLDALVRFLSESAPVTIELVHLAGQSIVNKLAISRGFHRDANAPSFTKIAVGRPLTADTWSSVVQQVRRRTGLVLPDSLLALSRGGEIDICTAIGAFKRVSGVALEDLLGPTVLVWPGRDGVIVPITRSYADELLGTAVQASLGFVVHRDASFLSLRGYVNSPRATKQMRPGSPIIFYESKRNRHGRGAAVAVARIVDSVLVPKSKVDSSEDKRLVVDSVEEFSTTDDVLLTTFDNLIPFPHPVGFQALKKLGCVGGANLISAVSLSSEQITSILTCGWSGVKIR
jgi:GNAT superfamily N-acetyltransferase